MATHPAGGARHLPQCVLLCILCAAAAPVCAQDYERLGGGYCSDWVYLPEGAYPPPLDLDNPLYDADPVAECMKRCLAAVGQGTRGGGIGDQAFYVKWIWSGDEQVQGCACSSGTCSSRAGSANLYESYGISQTAASAPETAASTPGEGGGGMSSTSYGVSQTAASTPELGGGGMFSTVLDGLDLIFVPGCFIFAGCATFPLWYPLCFGGKWKSEEQIRDQLAREMGQDFGNLTFAVGAPEQGASSDPQAARPPLTSVTWRRRSRYCNGSCNVAEPSG